VIELVGPKGYIHNWHYVGPQAVGAKVFHSGLGNGTVTGHDGKSVKVKFSDGAERTFGAHPGAKPGKLVRHDSAEAPGKPSAAPKAASAPKRAAPVRAAPKAASAGKPAAPGGNALRGDTAYGHIAEPAGKKERDAAAYYSVASKRLNTPLRSGTKVKDKEDAAQLRGLESAFAKSPPTTSHIVAYRGTAGSLFGEGDATGTQFTDKGFTSVSTDPKQAAMFGPEKGSAVMEIHVPAGSKVVKPGSEGQYSSGDDAEKELVLNHGGRYEITSDQMVGGVRKLTATYRGSA
jgi:hypothetical protein